MAWLKGFTYDGIESLDYDLYITSGSVYDAPERVVDMIKVPGRNGNLAIDRGKFENIDVEYNVYTKDRSQTSFAQNIRDFRNELCSRHEYLRLTDDYNSDEFRLGIYKSGLKLDADIDRAGAIKLVFDCKPQRFLTAGETEKNIPEWSDVHSDSGSLVTLDNSSGEYVVKSLSATIEPQQSGSGDPSPTNIRPITGFDSVNINVSGNQLIDTSTNESGALDASGNEVANSSFNRTQLISISQGTIFFRSDIASGYTVRIHGYNNGAWVQQLKVVSTSVGYETSITIPSTVNQVRISYPTIGINNTYLYEGNTYSVSFGSAGTVYGGTLDVVSGQLTVTHQIIDLSTLTWTYGSAYSTTDRAVYYATNTPQKSYQNNQLAPCYAEKYISAKINDILTTTGLIGQGTNNRVWCSTTAQGTTPTGNFVYELATHLTYQLTATQAALLLGTNNVWSNTGDIQIEYGKGGNTLFNPTLFESKPLIELSGAGTLGINNYIITVTGSGQLFIDCDTMEAYTITGGVVTSANNRVSLNTTDYPVLRSGINNFTVGIGISGVKITPRWWRV